MPLNPLQDVSTQPHAPHPAHSQSHSSIVPGTEHLGKAPVTRIRWNLHNASIMTPGWVIRAERVNEIEELEGDEGTEYRTWEAFGGLAARKVKSKYESVLQERFSDWCRDLKKYVEEGQQQHQQQKDADGQSPTREGEDANPATGVGGTKE